MSYHVRQEYSAESGALAESMPAALTAADDAAPAHAASKTPQDAGESHDAVEAVGVVKWFNDQKGFGFISDADGKDVFVHYAVIEGEGFKTLEDGERVHYAFVEGPKGRKATRVLRG